MKKFKTVLSFLIFTMMLFSFASGRIYQTKAEENMNGVTPVTEANVYEKTKYYKEGPLGIMGGFHLVGFNSVETKAHTNGNILADTLKYQSNFGTNGIEEVSYIRKLQNPVAGFKSTSNNQSILVVGQEITVTTADNGQAWALNGQKADFPRKSNNPNGLWQDTDSTKFINIEAEKQKAIAINQKLRTYQDSNTVGHFEDQNNQYVEIANPGGLNVYNLDPNKHYDGYNVDAKGFEKGKNGTLIFNVDLKGKTSFTMPGSLIKYKDGSTAPTSEVTTWQDGNTIWNFYDSSQPDGQYHGKINNSRAVTGIILAPSATVDLTQNFNGTTIANDIIVTAESHRTDYTGKTLDPTEISVKITKKWEGQKLDKVKVRLFADGKPTDKVAELSEANGWSHTFSKLAQKDSSGKVINYTVDEEETPGYTKEISGDPTTGFVIKNTKKNIEKINITGTKTWEDNNNQDGKRPSKIKVKLLADGKVIQEKEVTEKDGWKYNFDNLDKFKDGKEINYTIDEDVIEFYQKTVDGFNLTNKYIPEKIKVEGTKTWKDNNNRDGKRPESITVNLLKNGQKIDSKVVTAANNWTYTFDNLPKYENGQEIKYTLTEDKVEGYTTEVKGYDITNSYTPGKTSVTVNKAWNDNNNQDGLRKPIQVQLYANGEKVGDAVTLSDDNNWTYTWTELAEKANKKVIRYEVKEVSTLDGYTTKVAETSQHHFVVTNNHTPDVTSISGVKTWNDNNDQDGKRPKSIKVHLLANGIEIASKEVTAKDDWKYSFDNLPVNKDAQKIAYTVSEDTVEGYTTTVDGTNITNSHTPDVTSVSGVKTWDDKDNQDGKRPESITVNLLANGKKVHSKIVTAADNWAYAFEALPKYENGKEITYTVEEEKVDGYTAITDGYNITNTYKPETTSVKVNKIWKDNDDQDKLRPNSITINLLANGKVIKTATVTKTDDWSYEFTDLPKFLNGQKIIYSVEEVNVPKGYDATIDGTTITNVHIPKTPDSPVKKLLPSTGDKASWMLTILGFVLVVGIVGVFYYKHHKA